MSGQTLSVEVDYTAHDVAAEVRYHMTRGRGFVGRWFDGWVPLVAVAAASVVAGVRTSPYVGAMFFLGLPAFGYLVTRGRIQKLANAAAVQSSAQFGLRRILISAEGLVVERPDGAETYAWAGIRRVFDLKDLVLIYADAGRAIVSLPKRAFRDREAVAEATGLLREYRRSYPRHVLAGATAHPGQAVEIRLRARDFCPFQWKRELLLPVAVLGMAVGLMLLRSNPEGREWAGREVIVLGLGAAVLAGLLMAILLRFLRLARVRGWAGRYRIVSTPAGILIERPLSSQMRGWPQVALPKRGRNTAVCVPGYPDFPLVPRAFASEGER